MFETIGRSLLHCFVSKEQDHPLDVRWAIANLIFPQQCRMGKYFAHIDQVFWFEPHVPLQEWQGIGRRHPRNGRRPRYPQGEMEC